MGNPVILTSPDYTNKALADPNVKDSIADILIDVLKPLPTTIGTPTDTDIATDLANIQTGVDAIPDAAAIKAEVDSALNTEIPASNTANSVNDILLDKLAPRLPVSGTLSTLVAATVNTEVDNALNTIVPASPTAGSLNDILSKAAGGNTFDKTTDSLEAIRDKIDTLPTSIPSPIVSLAGTCAVGMSASTTTIVCSTLAGYGDDLFNNKYWMTILKNANSVGSAPEQEYRQITDYVSSTGTFTVLAFSANVEANDDVLVLHESLIPVKFVELTSGSGYWTVPAGVNIIDVVIVGAGGSGAGGSDNAGGGGGGETVFLKNYRVTPRTTKAYVIGAGGPSSGTDTGNNGANTSFDNYIAYGGVSGYATAGGKGGSPVTGGDGGAVSTSGSDGTTTFNRCGGGGGAGRGAGLHGGNGSFGTGGSTTSTGGGGGGSYANGGNGWGGAAGGGGYVPGDDGTENGVNSGAGGNGGILIMWR